MKNFEIFEIKYIKSSIVPNFKINKDVDGATIDETFFKQIIGSLMYLATTRPNIMFNVSLISWYGSKPTQLRLQVAKTILSTTTKMIFYKNYWFLGSFTRKGEGGEEHFFAFTNFDYARDEEDSKSTSG